MARAQRQCYCVQRNVCAYFSQLAKLLLHLRLQSAMQLHSATEDVSSDVRARAAWCGTLYSGVIHHVIPGRRATIQPWRRNCGCCLRACTCRAYSFSNHSTVNPGCLAAAGSSPRYHAMKHASCSLYAMHNSPDTCPKAWGQSIAAI